MKLLKIFASIIALFVTVILVQSIFPHNAGLVYGILVFTAPGGIATPFAFNMNYLPQFLTFNNVVPLTTLRIETQEDGVLHDWTAAGIAAVNGYMVLGAQAANIVTLRVANGHLKNKNVTISGVTSAAGAIGFFVCSDNLGSYAFKTNNAAILALNPTRFENFTAVFAPTMAAVTDRCEVVYNNGHQEIYNINDLAAMTSMFQEVPAIMVNNINAYIKSATFTCAAATPAYVFSVKI
jgi:hypothetical protein